MSITPVIRFYKPKEPFGEFSNFYVNRRGIEIDTVRYKSVEHYFQAMKFDEYPGYFDMIARANTPGIAKYLARQEKKYQYQWQRSLNDRIGMMSRMIL